jgi:hypothetical protein
MMTYPYVPIKKRHLRPLAILPLPAQFPQRMGGVPSQRGQFTYKYQAHWKEDLSM